MSRFSTFLPLHVRLILALARVELLYPMIVCCLIGAGIFVHGIFVEASELHPLRALSIAEQTVDVAQVAAFEYPSLMEYVSQALHGQLPRKSENMQVTAMVIMYAGMVVIMFSILSARAMWRMQVRMSPVAGRVPKTK